MGPGIKFRHLLVVHLTSEEYPLEYLAPLVPLLGNFYLIMLLGWCGWGSLAGMQGGVAGIGCGVGVGVVGLGISLMQRDFMLSGTGSSSHTGLFRSAVWGGFFNHHQSVSGVNGGISLKVKHWQTPSQNAGF